jgi:cellulose synthase/poly-beta-1,6-N-acetylglucosamine synthase-like glycosyltransferase
VSLALVIALAVLHGLITVLLAVCATHYALLTVFTLIRRCGSEPAPELDRARLPWVTVQLPVYNEVHVVERIIDHAAALDYPRELLEIQVLDDSSDDTARLVDARVAFHRTQGVDIRVLRRSSREGFKAGALRHGLAEARGEFIAVFDADFCPAPDFLLRVMPYFDGRPRLGMLQTRWSHLNPDDSLFTQTQALILDGHFMIEQRARYHSGLLMTFNGTGGVWRRSCIEDAGGWQHESLAEDLDLSFRAHLAGWECLFLPDVTVPGEVPPQLAAFKRQQARWAQGAFQALRKLGWSILTSRRLKWHQKGMALLHLSSHAAHPLMVALLLISPALVLVPSSMRLNLGAAGLVFLGPPLLYLTSQWQLYRGWGRLRALPALVLLGIGIAWSNAQAVWRGLTRNGGEFVRTPKFRLEGGPEKWSQSAYRVRMDATTFVELFLALYALGTCVVAWNCDDRWLSISSLLCALAFGAVGVLGLLQGRGARMRAPAAAVAPVIGGSRRE